MKKEIVVLAYSWRPGGVCIAGICANTNEWIRPISMNNEDAIPLYYVKNINLLDVVEIDFSGQKPSPSTKYQKENEYVSSYNWKITGQMKINQVRKYCNSSGFVLHSANDTVAPSFLDKLPTTKWDSLQLIEADIVFSDAWNNTQWRANFYDPLGNQLALKVKDIRAIEQLKQKKNIDGRCLLTISLAQPYQPPDEHLPFLCYKLVAGIIHT